MSRWILLSLIFASLSAQAQTIYEVQATNLPLTEVLEDVTSRYRLKFSFDPEKTNKLMVTRRIRTFSEGDLISELFRDLPFRIQLSNGIYLLVPRRDFTPKPKLVQGRVKDGRGEPVAFALVESGQEGTITNEHGYFTLGSTFDSISLEISHVGFKSHRRKVASAQGRLEIQMEEDATELEEVVLLSDYLRQQKVQPSVFRMNPGQISRLPSLGNVDVFKSIQLLPGISATDETSAGLSVRGGTPEQNLVLLDGFNLYHLDHFFGIFSTFNPNTLRNVEVYKGGFGAEYGGRVSSVVVANGKYGNDQKLSGGLGLNMISGDAFLEGPLGKNTTFNFGFRRSYMDLVESGLYQSFLKSNRTDALAALDETFNEGLEVEPEFYFYDFSGKLNHRFGSNASVDFNLYRSQDVYEGSFEMEDEFQVSAEDEAFESSSSVYEIYDLANWSNTGLSVNLKANVLPGWYSETSLGYSKYRTEAGFENRETFEAQAFNSDPNLTVTGDTTFTYLSYHKFNELRDLTLRTHHEITLDDRHALELGTEINQINTDYRLRFYAQAVEEYNPTETILAGYVQHKFNTSRFRSSVGFRYMTYTGTAIEKMAPRLSVNYDLSPSLTLKAAWSRHYQFLNRMSITPFGNTDQNYWVLANDQAYPTLGGRHLIFGAELQRNDWTVDLEFYDKFTTGNLESEFALPLEAGASVASVDDLLAVGENWSSGMDLLIKRRERNFEAWLSYSLSKSENQFGSLNLGRRYPAFQDQRHEVNMVGVYTMGDWDFSAVFIYGSGKPFTPPGITNGVVENLYDVNRVNALRLPAYHRMDLAVKYNFELNSTQGQAGITLFNVYNHQNIRSRRYTIRYEYDFVNDTGQNTEIVPINSYLLGFTPNLFVKISF